MNTPEAGSGQASDPLTGWDTIAVVAPCGTITQWSPGAERLLGYSPATVIGRPAAELLADRLPAPVRERWAAQEAWTEVLALRHQDGSTVDCRLHAAPLAALAAGDGQIAWLLTGVRVGPNGNREQDPLIHWSFDQSPFAKAIFDTHGRFLRVNTHMSRQMAASEDALRGLRLTEHLPGAGFEAPERAVDRVSASGEAEYLEDHVKVPGEPRAHAWMIYIAPLKDAAGTVRGVQLAALDFSEQHQIRERLALVNEAGRTIGSTLDVSRTAQELADVAVPVLADYVSVDLLDAVLHGDEPGPVSADRPLTLRRVAVGSSLQPFIASGEESHYPEFSPPLRCLATGHPTAHRVNELEIARWLARDPERAAWASRTHPHSMMAVPLRARGTNLGVVLFTRMNPTAASYGLDDLQLAEELVGRAAVSIDNARRYTRERSTNLALQHSLLPRELPGQLAVEAAGRYLPAGSQAGVGGDWYDVIPLSGARVALVVGDVVGHGLHASVAMGRLRTAVRTLADIDLTPDELLAHLNDLVIRLRSGDDSGSDTDTDTHTATDDMGATCLYAVYDPVSRRCALASAGHLWPALATPDGAVDFVELPTGPPLGVGRLPFEAAEVELPEGSILALYTDGLVETRNRDVDSGLRALRSALATALPSLDAMCDQLLKAILDDRPTDDVALLLARTRALDAEQVASWELSAEPAVVAEARNGARTQLGTWKLDEMADVTELVVSELVTNAIRYGTPPIRLRLIKNDTLICEVSDGSSTAPHLRRARTLDEGGRGLMLIAQLTDRWGARYTGTGKTIWAEQRFHTEALASGAC